jgi:hypothetical protein
VYGVAQTRTVCNPTPRGRAALLRTGSAAARPAFGTERRAGLGRDDVDVTEDLPRELAILPLEIREQS